MVRRLFLSIIFSLATQAPGYASAISFIQDGWAEGGPLFLSFAGSDFNVDGWIEQSELSDFRADYYVPDGTLTTWLSADLQPDGFFFADSGNFLVFATNGHYSLIDSGFEGEVLATIIDRFLFPVDHTESGLTATPEPATMFTIGFAMIAGALSRRR